MPRVKHTDERLTEVVANNISMAGVLRDLGLRQAGGNHSHIGRRVKALGLDTSHWKRQSWKRGTVGKRRVASEVLIRKESGKREHAYLLRRALIEIGRPYKCEDCGVGDTWNGASLTLEVDHVDRNWLNNEPGNLRLLCPNCHSQYGTSDVLVPNRVGL